jgi:hypothetical protein
MLHIKPGTIAPVRPLVGVLHAAHLDKVAAFERNAAHRAATGAAPSEAEDGVHPEHPGEWVEPAGLAGVMVAPVILSAQHRADLLTALQEAYREGDAKAVAKAERDYVKETLYLVDGLTDQDGKPTGVYRDEETGAFTEDDMEAFHLSGLLPFLFAAMLSLQSLPSGKAWRFGVLQPST